VCIFFFCVKSSEEFLFKLTKRNLLFLFLNLFSVFMKNFAQAYLVNLRNSRLLCSNSDSISFFEFGSATSWTSLFTIVSRIVAFILDCANLFSGLPSEFDSCFDTSSALLHHVPLQFPAFSQNEILYVDSMIVNIQFRFSIRDFRSRDGQCCRVVGIL
jgi:hypothetical protein